MRVVGYCSQGNAVGAHKRRGGHGRVGDGQESYHIAVLGARALAKDLSLCSALFYTRGWPIVVDHQIGPILSHFRPSLPRALLVFPPSRLINACCGVLLFGIDRQLFSPRWVHPLDSRGRSTRSWRTFAPRNRQWHRCFSHTKWVAVGIHSSSSRPCVARSVYAWYVVGCAWPYHLALSSRGVLDTVWSCLDSFFLMRFLMFGLH